MTVRPFRGALLNCGGQAVALSSLFRWRPKAKEEDDCEGVSTGDLARASSELAEETASVWEIVDRFKMVKKFRDQHDEEMRALKERD